MHCYLLLLSFGFFGTLYPVLTGVTTYRTPSDRSLVLCSDFHDNRDLDASLRSRAEQQYSHLQQYFAGSKLLAELPRKENNDILGLLKQKKAASGSENLENRGDVLTVLAVLERRRLGLARPVASCNITLDAISHQYETVLNDLKDRYLRESKLADISAQTFKEIDEHNRKFSQDLEQQGLKPEHDIVKLYDAKRPLDTLNTVHAAWRRMFDLNALHRAHTQLQQGPEDVLVCVGSQHADALSHYFSQMNDYQPEYSHRSSFWDGDNPALERASLTNIEFKKAAGLLSPNLWGTLSGYIQDYTNCIF